MTIKNLAYRVQQRLSAATDGSFKRSHVYELFAAAFGHSSYAALCSESVFTQARPSMELPELDVVKLQQRSHDLGYASSIDAITTVLSAELKSARLGAVRIQDIVEALLTSSDDSWTWNGGENELDIEEPDVPAVHDLIDFESEESPAYLIESLESAASRSNALAHYALALLYREDDEDDSLRPQGSAYWHEQRLSGEQLSPAASEWADEYQRRTELARKSDLHLRQAARLGNSHALLDLADIDGDPTFFETELDVTAIEDPARAAAIADRLGRPADEQRWLTRAAESGDIEAMQTLIDSIDKEDLERCWTWVHLGRLLGTDLTRSDMRAYHDGGPQADQEYDDDFGGPAYVGGREAIKLEPISEDAERVVRQRAATLYKQIRTRRGRKSGSRSVDQV
jgi:hypothetical protein